MKTNVNALKDLFVKFGGSLSTVYTDISPDPVGEYVSISAMIEACAKVGGSSLPDVTSADNGDVLTVVNGSWNKAEATTELPAVTSADNGDVLTVVEGEWNKAEAPKSNVEAIALTLDGTTISTELTSGEIIELAESGKVLVCVNDLTEAGQGVQFYPVGLVSSNPNAMSVFVINGTDDTVVSSKLTASTDSDPFTMTVGG